MKPVLCVRNDRDDTLGISAAALADRGVPVLRLDAFESSVRWSELEEVAGLIVFGGAMNVDETRRYPFLQAERRLMRRAVDGGLPVLGICLGAQLLARALDARVYRAPVRELGFSPVRITEGGLHDRLLGSFRSGDRVFQWHEDTYDLPKGGDLLAVGDAVPNQAFRFGSNAWGVQFHCEVDLEGVEAWLRSAGPSLELVWNRRADEIRDELQTYLAAQQERSRPLLHAFAELVCETGAPRLSPQASR